MTRGHNSREWRDLYTELVRLEAAAEYVEDMSDDAPPDERTIAVQDVGRSVGDVVRAFRRYRERWVDQ